MRNYTKIFSLFLFLIFLLAGAVWKFRNVLIERAMEQALNTQLAVFFNQTLDVRGVHLQSNLYLTVDEILGDWQAPEGAFALEIQDIRVQESILKFIQQKPVRVVFGNLKPKDSKAPGIRGEAIVKNDTAGSVELTADFLGIPLEEMTPLDPEHLKGASGELRGTFKLKSDIQGAREFNLNLKVTPPGGRLQARFFDLLIPYLPAAQRAVLETISGTKTVRYQKADIQLERSGPETVKALLHIQVPDYNLNLNLNVTIRVESEDVFLQLAELFGLIKVSA